MFKIVIDLGVIIGGIFLILYFVRKKRTKKNQKNLKSSFSLPLSGEAGPAQIPLGLCGVNSRGYRLGEFLPRSDAKHLLRGRPPSQSRAKSVRIFSNTHRQVGQIAKISAICLLLITLSKVLTFKSSLSASANSRLYATLDKFFQLCLYIGNP